MQIFLNLFRVFRYISILLITTFLLSCVLPVTLIHAEEGDFVWAKALGGNLGTGEDAYGICVDGSGSVYTTGYFYFTVDFDPGPGIHELTSQGNKDIYISKLDHAGNFVWAKNLGSFSNDSGEDIAVDSSGNVYITGSFYGTVDFDPGPETFNLISEGGKDIFVSKLDSGGNFVWAKNMGGNFDDYAYSVFVDSSGNVYTTGNFDTAADFDPGDGTFLLTSAGDWNIFVSKLDSSGGFVWAKAMGGAEYSVGRGIAVDGSGNVFTTGWFYGTADFDPGDGTCLLTSTIERDIFISKLDSAGNFAWAKRIGEPLSWDSGMDIAVDGSGNVYTTGFFTGTVDFDPGWRTFDLESDGSTDIFVSKLNSNGHFIWARGMGGDFDDSAYGISVGSSGNVYTTGTFKDTVDFDPGPGTFNLTSEGEKDIFISQLDSGGDFVWAKAMGGGYTDYGRAVSVDGSGNVYATGYFNGTADFDPGPETFNLTSTIGQDVFIVRLEGSPFPWPLFLPAMITGNQ